MARFVGSILAAACVLSGHDDALMQQAVERVAQSSVSLAENTGQWPAEVLFAGATRHGFLSIERDGFTLRRERGAQPVRLSFGRAATDVEGLGPRPGVLHDLRAGRRATGARIYAGVLFRGAFDGVDVVVFADDAGVHYDLLAEDGGDAEAARILLEGVDSVASGELGTALALQTPSGVLLHGSPVAWSVPDGEEVESQVGTRGEFVLGLDVGPTAGPVYVDPGLVWSTYLGGEHFDEYVTGLTVAADGSVLVVGNTDSIGFPTTPGALGGDPGDENQDGFMSRFDAHGRLVYSTYLGGSGVDWLQSVVLLEDERIVVVGRTWSTDIGLGEGGYQESIHGIGDVFIAIISADGSSIESSTFFGGGTSVTEPNCVIVGLDGSILVAGTTLEADLPLTPGAFDTQFSGFSEGYIARFSPALDQLLFSTYIGGDEAESLRGLAQDPRSGHLLAVGHTDSPDFPTTSGAFKETLIGSENDGYVVRLSEDGTTLVASTLLGGSEGLAIDRSYRVGLAPDGDVIVLGATRADDFPVTEGAFDTEYDGCIICGPDATVTRLTPDLSALVYSTFLGGFGFEEETLDMTIDVSGAPILTGKTTSFNYPTTPGALSERLKAGSDDAFVTKLHQDGSRLVYSTFLGGIGNELVASSSRSPVAVLADGSVVVGGNTNSPDFPVTPGAFQTEPQQSDGFVSRLDLLATGVTRHGTASAGCAGDPIIGAAPWARVGSHDFELTGSNAPPITSGYLVVSEQALTDPLFVAGAAAWVDFGHLIALAALTSDDVGYVELRLAIPDDPVLEGTAFQAQMFWPDGCAAGGFCATPALEVVVQP